MTKTTYFCDKCGLQGTSRERYDYWTQVKFQISGGKCAMNDAQIDLCRRCSLDVGVLIETAPEGRIEIQKETNIKSQMFELFQELIRKTIAGEVE